MNLKESFRYQRFLDSLMYESTSSLNSYANCFQVQKTHLRGKANPELNQPGLEAEVEIVESDRKYTNDNVMRFMRWLVSEKEKLSNAIGKAKASIPFDIDAAVEVNKYRQRINSSIRNMLKKTPGNKTETGVDYKFNMEGNQVPYHYEIEVTYTDAFDREWAKKIVREIISDADTVSSEIDAAMINTEVEYEPKFDVNETFEDVMVEFVKLTF